MSSTDASPDLSAIFGANVRSARELAKLTQHELARRIGGKTTNQAVSDWERGVNRPSDPNLVRLATVLGHPVAWFFSDHDDSAVLLP